MPSHNKEKAQIALNIKPGQRLTTWSCLQLFQINYSEFPESLLLIFRMECLSLNIRVLVLLMEPSSPLSSKHHGMWVSGAQWGSVEISHRGGNQNVHAIECRLKVGGNQSKSQEGLLTNRVSFWARPNADPSWSRLFLETWTENRLTSRCWSSSHSQQFPDTVLLKLSGPEKKVPTFKNGKATGWAPLPPWKIVLLNLSFSARFLFWFWSHWSLQFGSK